MRKDNNIMKNSINLSYDSDKLSALQMFMEQKNLNLNDELIKCVETLYQKNVPQTVRDFIDMKASAVPVKKTVKEVEKVE